MLKIEVGALKVKEVTKKATGEIFSIPELECHAHIPGEKYPVALKLNVVKGKQPPAQGVYFLPASCFYVGQYDKLEVRGQVVDLLLNADQAREALQKELAELPSPLNGKPPAGR